MSAVFEWSAKDALIRQSRRPGPPWERSTRWYGFALEMDSQRFAGLEIDHASGYQRESATRIDDGEAWTIDHRARSITPSGQTFAEAATDALLYSPLALLTWLSNHPNAADSESRTEVHEGAEFQVLPVRIGGSEVELLFHNSTHRLHGVRHGYRDYDGNRVPLFTRYDTAVEQDGFLQPENITLTVRGEPGRRLSLRHLAWNQSMGPYLERPDYRSLEPEPEALRKFKIDEIAQGIYFVGQGVMYQLFVEWEDSLVALDGSSGDVQKRIQAIREQVPGKPFRHVLVSHHHDDHLHGLDDFSELGASLLVLLSHAEVARRYVMEETGKAPELQTVEDGQWLGTGDNRMQMLDLGPLPHSEHLLAAWLPGKKILFTADLFVLGARREPVEPASPNAEALLAAIESRGLDVERIIDPHSPLIATMEDLRAAIQRQHQNDSTQDPSDFGPWATLDAFLLEN